MKTSLALLAFFFTVHVDAATWFSRENSLTHLKKNELQRMMGLAVDKNRDVDFAGDLPNVKSELPPALDWRNKDGKNWVSPILNQANCGSCVAFASIGVLETQYKISSFVPTFNIKLSPQHLFACGGGACERGWMPETAANFLMKKGVPDESCLPYTSGATGEDVACRASCADQSQRSVRIANYSRPTRFFKNVEAVKAALQKGPVVTTLSVYSDFISYGGGVYKHTTGDYLGGHAISIIGYDDATRSFIIRNSWGEEWGEGGFGRVSYDDSSGVGHETWLFEMPSMMGGVSLESPTDYSYFTTTMPLSAFSTYPSTDSLSMAIYDSASRAVWSGSCKGSRCGQDVDIRGLPDGRYEAQVIAMNQTGARIGASTRQFFYVVNQAPQLSLAFTGAQGTNLDREVKGRIVFDINTTSSSVPMSALEFHFKDTAGKETVRTAEVVLSHMTLGWRTPAVPNGAYEVWLTGRVKTASLDVRAESPHKTINVRN